MEQTATVLNITDEKEVKAEAVAVKSEAKALSLRDQIKEIVTVKPDNTFLVTVTTADQFVNAGKIRERAEEERKAVYDDLNSFCVDANALHKRLVAKRDSGVLPYDTLIKAIKSGGETYLREEKRKEEEAAAILREKARKEEEDRILREAAELEAEGRPEEANEILEEPVVFVAPIPKSNIPTFDARKFNVTAKVSVKVNDRMKFLSNIPALTLMECLNESSWTTIEGGLAKKAKALGKAFNFAGCTVTEA
jgi:hypothetical protein